MLKISPLFKKFENFLWVSNSRILRVKNKNFSGYYFYINTNIQADFQICITVALRNKVTKLVTNRSSYPEQLY